MEIGFIESSFKPVEIRYLTTEEAIQAVEKALRSLYLVSMERYCLVFLVLVFSNVVELKWVVRFMSLLYLIYTCRSWD